MGPTFYNVPYAATCPDRVVLTIPHLTEAPMRDRSRHVQQTSPTTQSAAYNGFARGFNAIVTSEKPIELVDPDKENERIAAAEAKRARKAARGW